MGRYEGRCENSEGYREKEDFCYKSSVEPIPVSSDAEFIAVTVSVRIADIESKKYRIYQLFWL